MGSHPRSRGLLRGRGRRDVVRGPRGSRGPLGLVGVAGRTNAAVPGVGPGRPAAEFTPFARAAALGTMNARPEMRLAWEMPSTPTPVVPPGATHPDVPVLALTGELDDGVPLADQQGALAPFPHSTRVTFVGLGHNFAENRERGQAVASDFVRDLRVGDISCESKP